jgi:hypothetical protein
MRAARRLLTILLVAAGLLSSSFPTIASADELLYVNTRWAVSYVNINCQAPASKSEYPCSTLDPTLEVMALVARVINFLAIEKDCESVRYFTSETTDISKLGQMGAYWELQLAIGFGDENAAPHWQLFSNAGGAHDPANIKGWEGDDKPKEIAHFLCGIVTKRGAQPK